MRPSFFSLFKRGKYFHHAPVHPSDSGIVPLRGDIKEVERFAAASIAFAWEHSSSIRQHFWNTICHFADDPDLSPEASIEIEPFPWADLLITNPTPNGNFLYVIECKSGAGLDPIQNPEKGEFTCPDGYGFRFASAFKGTGAKMRFVVFGYRDKIAMPDLLRGLNISLQQRGWGDFAAGFPREQFARDLAISLGKLGVGAFPSSEMQKVKVDTSKVELGNAIRTFAEVQRRLGWPSGKASERNFYNDGEWWFIGMDLNPSDKVLGSEKLRDDLHPPERSLFWFGYQGQEMGPSELAVYIYCGDPTRQKKLAQSLCRKLPGFTIKVEPPDKQFHSVTVVTQGHAVSSDTEWFCTIFQALGLHIYN